MELMKSHKPQWDSPSGEHERVNTVSVWTVELNMEPTGVDFYLFGMYRCSLVIDQLSSDIEGFLPLSCIKLGLDSTTQTFFCRCLQNFRQLGFLHLRNQFEIQIFFAVHRSNEWRQRGGHQGYSEEQNEADDLKERHHKLVPTYDLPMRSHSPVLHTTH